MPPNAPPDFTCLLRHGRRRTISPTSPTIRRCPRVLMAVIDQALCTARAQVSPLPLRRARSSLAVIAFAGTITSHCRIDSLAVILRRSAALCRRCRRFSYGAYLRGFARHGRLGRAVIELPRCFRGWPVGIGGRVCALLKMPGWCHLSPGSLPDFAAIRLPLPGRCDAMVAACSRHRAEGRLLA